MYLKTAVAAVAVIMIGQAPPPGVRPTSGRPACRTFPIAGTQVTVSPVARSVVTYTGHFDAYQVRMENDMTFSDNRGSRFSNKTATTWASTADFVNEAVRSSGTGAKTLTGLTQLIVTPGFFERSDTGRGLYLSTAFSGTYRSVAAVLSPTTLTVSGAGAVADSDRVEWSINTIPPLKLSKSTTLTGDTPITSVNSFDAGGRLVRFVNTLVTANTANQPMATDYTAWDRIGRPTSGSVVGPQHRQTITMVHDDVALTQTTTFTTIPTGGATTTSVMKETFDQNGNTVLQEWQTPAGRTTTTFTFQKMDIVCTGPINKPAVTQPVNAGPPDPGYPAKGTMTVSIDGASWKPSLGLTGQLTNQQIGPRPTDRSTILGIGASDLRYRLGIGVNVTAGTGTYTVAFDSAQPARGMATATLADSTSQGSWQAGGSIGRGTVTITSVSATGAAGSFNLVLDATRGTSATGTRTITGTFNITF